ncbi:uncharacterized protein LACBIDRAFT_311907 [Laccaria bicolor S238N-H82]|uniref:Predicted protein n=1 Tax=Laccaria bicolor (strain S238N-H82 / ATCC MYA-4686) TaxID=486041 RepID=B0CYK9_LACBS|nr:uncharacterized protein LACBIDRAFT_311907 [Laccaria bicolor S238N-H82]EDR12903.1 predicted protein [Laccaria bicolor S238N-H82]|eukprot:XP_001877167.1 predicted protein [Laccaria bicolor S238N-H82]
MHVAATIPLFLQSLQARRSDVPLGMEPWGRLFPSCSKIGDSQTYSNNRHPPIMNPTTDCNPIVRSKEKLVRHTSKVRFLNLSNDGSFLLSAVIVWNLKRGLHQAINPSNGLVTALAWIPIGADVNGAFAFGCRDGVIHLYCRTGNKDSFTYSASVHLEDGSVKHLGFNSNLLCVVGVGVTAERAHFWRIDGKGHLIAVPQPEDEPAFVDGFPKYVFRPEIAFRYANGDHILIKPSIELGAIDLNRWATRAPGLIYAIHSVFHAQKVHEFAGLVFAVVKLIFAIMVILALFAINIYIFLIYKSSLYYDSFLRSD